MRVLTRQIRRERIRVSKGLWKRRKRKWRRRGGNVALRIWAPLNGDLRQIGASNVILTNNSATVDNNGKIGKCYSFNGNNYYIALTGQELFDCFKGGTTAFSICMWVYHADTRRAILFGDYGLSNSIGFNIELNTGHGLRFYWNGSPDYSPGINVGLNTWNHITLTYDGASLKSYLNGNLVATRDGVLATRSKTAGEFRLGRDTRTTDTALNGKLNDICIYDHCLSAAEVKEIAQGLVLHYKLNQPIGLTDIILNQDTYAVYNNYASSGTIGTLTNLSETFNGHVVRREVMTPNDTSVNNFKSALGSHGVYGHRQTFLANTKYVFWIYYRPISHTNVRVGGTASNIGGWTEIPPVAVGSGWYRVGQYRNGTVTTDKTDSIFTSFYTPTAASGVPITIDWAAPHLLVGTTEIPDDDSFMGNDYIEDSSGYGHHGSITGNIVSNSNTPRYLASSSFNGTERIVADSLGADIRTLSCWCKTTKNKSTSQHMVADSFSNMCISFYNGTIIGVFGTTRSTGSKSTLGTSYKENDWNHIVVVKTDDAGARDIYCNGVKLTPTTNDYWGAATGFYVGARNTSNGNPFYGEISDVRAYCTALSADDILQLYHTSAKIDNKQNLHTFELVEPATRISINKQGQILCNELEETSATKFFKTNQIIETNNLIEL